MKKTKQMMRYSFGDQCYKKNHMRNSFPALQKQKQNHVRDGFPALQKQRYY